MSFYFKIMTTIHELTQLAQELCKVRSEAAALKDTLGFLKEKRDGLQACMLEMMQAERMKQYKTDTATISRAVKSDIRIVDEPELVAELAARKVLDQYYVSRIDMAPFKSFANALLKETGEVLMGIEPVRSEYLSIRTPSS